MAGFVLPAPYAACQKSQYDDRQSRHANKSDGYCQITVPGILCLIFCAGKGRRRRLLAKIPFQSPRNNATDICERLSPWLYFYHGVYTRRSSRRSVARSVARLIARPIAPCKHTCNRSRNRSRRSVARPIAATIAPCKHAITLKARQIIF